MNNLLYTKQETCPVCQNTFLATKVRKTKLCKKSQDSDFFTIYEEGIFPFFYDVYLCPECGYAALETRFHHLTQRERENIIKKLSSEWKKRPIPFERNPKDALMAYKLALYVAGLKEEKPSQLALLCHRIAWIYRIMEDKSGENRFLENAVNFYEKAVAEEEINDGIKLFYLIGELNRRLGKENEAARWLASVITEREKTGMIEMARDSWQKIREKSSNHF